jgi:hypothetical protein
MLEFAREDASLLISWASPVRHSLQVSDFVPCKWKNRRRMVLRGRLFFYFFIIILGVYLQRPTVKACFFPEFPLPVPPQSVLASRNAQRKRHKRGE